MKAKTQRCCGRQDRARDCPGDPVLGSERDVICVPLPPFQVSSEYMKLEADSFVLITFEKESGLPKTSATTPKEKEAKS